MFKVLVFVTIILFLLLVLSVFYIREQNKKLKKYKNDASYYSNAVVEANERINNLYRQIKGLQKIDDWKHTESQKPEEDVIADIININNNRVQNY